MAWGDLLAGLAFYLVIEGLLPFVAPQAWRRGLAAVARLEDTHLRAFGLGVVIVGLLLLLGIRG
ncbi:MAG TPA: DUF2065 domain-containing protein [Gammaproteobacteria bacterium]|nr:DUF2065 domain-containing protein [Gammaproteobacteria bacterium]